MWRLLSMTSQMRNHLSAIQSGYKVSFIKGLREKFTDSDVREQRGEEVQIFLVGNKTDLNEKRMVSTDEGEQCAIENKVRFLETSAKVYSGFNFLLSCFKFF